MKRVRDQHEQSRKDRLIRQDSDPDLKSKDRELSKMSKNIPKLRKEINNMKRRLETAYDIKK
jgi:hypothetical protein